MTEVTLTIRFEGGEADNGRLPIHDAATAEMGLARAVNIVTHSFANDEQMRRRGDSATGATVFASAPKKGCYEVEVDVVFDLATCEKMGASVIAPRYWDYLTWCWSFAVGKDYDPVTPYVQRLVESQDAKIDEIADTLESAMASLHKPIAEDPENIILVLSRKRVGDILTFDSETNEYVNVRGESDDDEYVIGNVTKFNILTNYGRVYDDNLRRVVSFKLIEDPSHRLRTLITKSMHDRVKGEGGKLHFLVRRVENAMGTVKRYVVADVVEVR
ncbi:DUF7946 domain-containing protein [Paraburkholderia aspalathi]|uniref:Uncharacterized protein n=1 Tax=Paraburkholderia aspalathi TaxID=1324617 RepID=A0A1I7EIW1_9BURK|nr:hypothetical protein [Paraburkholderia aspalathi]SFU23880.1 hypothetical protein SAMN05192563_1023112 [Paraburkholderia aspalathi]